MGGVPDETIIIDKVSGKDFSREGYNYLKKCLLRYGDTLVIKELDRLGRNKTAIKEELEYFAKNGIRVKITDLPTTMTEVQVGQDWIIQMINNILIEVLSNIAEQELIHIKARQKEGIEAMPVIDGRRFSSRSGNPVGRPSATYPSEWNSYYIKWKNHEITAAKFMRDLNLKKSTFYNLVHKFEKQ
jgi:hypothetical protein